MQWWSWSAALRLLLVAGAAEAAGPIGEPFPVNTYTTGLQAAPAAAAAGDGSFVVVWESTGQDGDYIGVFGQRFDDSGQPAGGEFQVNTYTFGRQFAPAVSAAGDGSFVVVWQGYGEGGDSGDVFARRYDAAGAARGPAFQVNEPVLAYEGAPAVAARPDGEFMVVWDDYDDVFARRYAGSGEPSGGPFQVNTDTSGYQDTATLASTADGGFVVAWTDGYYRFDGHDGSGYGIFGRRFDGAGQPAGGEFQVNAIALGDQYHPAVVPSPDGGFVVVWESYGHAGAASAIFARRFDAGGAPAGTEFEVSADPEALASEPAIGADANGNVAITWINTSRRDGASMIMARRFDGAGAPLGTAFPVYPDPGDDQLDPAVAVMPSGEFTVLWRSAAGDGSEGGIFARRFGLTPAEPTPTPTGTATPSATGSATATATPSATDTPLPTHTATATDTPVASATPTPVATPTTRACAGDCDGNGRVTVDELIAAVTIALGSQPLSRCLAADANGDAAVAIADLVAAVNRALSGCG